MSRRVASLILAALLTLAACSPAPDNTLEGDPDATSGPSPREESGAAPQVPNRPRAGTYVYDLIGLGETRSKVPAGSQLTEQLSVSSDTYTIEITNNQNANTQRIEFRWENERVVRLANETVIGGRRTSCRYDPPLEVLRIPIRQEEYREQEATGCDETTQISVVGREEIQDTQGKTWETWALELHSESGGRSDQATRWFSPELGREIRTDTTSETPEGRNETSQLLRSYPSG
jgi:hypothetical protein